MYRLVNIALICVISSVFTCSDLFAMDGVQERQNNRLQQKQRIRRPGRGVSRYRNKDDDWYRSAEGKKIADNVLSWQSVHGSWPKNMDTTAERFTGDPKDLKGTFDNRATTGEIRFLSRAYQATNDDRYKNAVIKAIDHILEAQYPTGGWPQFYPPDDKYHRYITFNDNAMVRLMYLLREVTALNDYKFVGPERRNAAKESFDKGIECILKCQIVVDGKLTVWCQQHDEVDYSPRTARTFEPIALCSLESVGILKLLMSLDNPDPKVVTAIEAAAKWFESTKIMGKRVVWKQGDRVLIDDPDSPGIWARFYELKTNRPVFEGRDGVIKYSMAEIERERRTGYGWYGTWPENVAADYAQWKKKQENKPKTDSQTPAQSKVFETNKKLGRGINFGNALEAPEEGQWGVTLKDEYFRIIKRTGFDTVRVPIRWSAHAEKEPPYTIDNDFFKRIDEVIEKSLSNGLCVVANMHHYDEIFVDPNSHTERFTAMWKQIADRYSDYPDNVLFELLNEPHNNLDDVKWNKLLAETLAEVRKTNPDRVIMIGPVSYNSINELSKLQLPEDDRNIIVSVHYYMPFSFTHQGAGWAGPFANMWIGTQWTGAPKEKKAVERDFDTAYYWGKVHNRPINVGEFGAYYKADMDSRAKWTNFIAGHAEEKGFSWMYWEFCSGFGAYDPDKNQWRQPLLKALIENP